MFGAEDCSIIEKINLLKEEIEKEKNNETPNIYNINKLKKKIMNLGVGLTYLNNNNYNRPFTKV